MTTEEEVKTALLNVFILNSLQYEKTIRYNTLKLMVKSVDDVIAGKAEIGYSSGSFYVIDIKSHEALHYEHPSSGSSSGKADT